MCSVTVFPDSSSRLRISEISISELGVLFRFSTVFLFSTSDFTFSDFGLSTFIFYFRPLSFLYTSSYSTTSDCYVSKPDFRPPTSTLSTLDPFFPFSTLKFHFQLSIRRSSFLNRKDRIWEGTLFIASHMWHQNMVPSKREVQQCIK